MEHVDALCIQRELPYSQRLMPIQDFITDRRNRITIGGLSGVGLIIGSIVGYSAWVKPALRIETPSPDNERLFEVSDRGAIGVGTGATPFGSSGDCLKSGGGSGNTMTFGPCGSGGAAFGTGQVITIGDDRYVRTAGDTMTGALSFLITGGTENTVSLEFPHTASGYHARLLKTLSVSGATILESSLTGATIAGFGLYDCEGTSNKLTWDQTTEKFKCESDQTSAVTAGQGLTLAGTVLSLTPSHSGTTIWATTALRSSGSLSVDGSMSGYSLTVSNLVSCENLQSSSAGTLSCNATDYITETELDTVAELEAQITDVDTFYTEDTTVPVVDGGTGFNSCTDGGFVFGDGTSALSCAAVLADNTIYIGDGTTEPTATALLECTASQKLQYTDSGNGLSCVADVDTTYTAGQGLTLTSTAFSLTPAHSGSIIKATTTLASSGTLSVDGAATFQDAFTFLGGSSDFLIQLDGTGDFRVNDGAAEAMVIYDNGASDEVVFNENSASNSFRIETNNISNMFVVNGDTDRVGIAVSTPKATLSVVGTISGSIVQGTTLTGTFLRGETTTKHVEITIVGSGSTVATGSGKNFFVVPPTMSGYYLKSVFSSVITTGTTNTTSIQIRDLSKGSRKLLSTVSSIDSAEFNTLTAATPAVINTTNRDVSGGSRLAFDIPAVSTTAPKVLIMVLEFFKP